MLLSLPEVLFSEPVVPDVDPEEEPFEPTDPFEVDEEPWLEEAGGVMDPPCCCDEEPFTSVPFEV